MAPTLQVIAPFVTIMADALGKTMEVIHSSQPLLFKEGDFYESSLPCYDGVLLVVDNVVHKMKISKNNAFTKTGNGEKLVESITVVTILDADIDEDERIWLDKQSEQPGHSIV